MCPLRVKLITAISIFIALVSVIPQIIVFLDPVMSETYKGLTNAYSQAGIISVQLIQSILGFVIILISCIYMLKGRKWALYLYTAWILFTLAMSLVITGSYVYLLYKIPITIFIFSFLYTGQSRRFFSLINRWICDGAIR
jgi:hypothetical protein